MTVVHLTAWPALEFESLQWTSQFRRDDLTRRQSDAGPPRTRRPSSRRRNRIRIADRVITALDAFAERAARRRTAG